jgi:branched-chain amino acid transport system permease protein
MEFAVPASGDWFVGMRTGQILALIVSTIALRTIDDYFIVCTLGIQVIVFSLMNNWMSLTRGPLGIPGIPGISMFGIAIESKWAFLLLTVAFATLIFFFLQKLTGSAFGRILRALSEDEIFTQSLGKNVYLSKVITFTISAMIAAIPGALYAHYISYIDPTSFTVDESIFILSIVIIGGMRNLWGSVVAAAFLVFLPEFLRFVGMPNAIAANMRQIIYGGILIFMMFRYSRGFEIQPMNAER